MVKSVKTTLSAEQELAIKLVTEDRVSVFITGNAGTGKSFITSYIIETFKKILHSDELAITATTGRAAVNIGGTTLHSFAGLGLATRGEAELLEELQYKKKLLNRWRSTKVLLVDEVSMLDANFFDKLNYIAKGVNKNKKPFGGIQLVFIGDLLQLPPVKNEDKPRKRVIESSAWNECISKTILLKKIYRQSDKEFSNILNHIRLGHITPDVVNYINSLEREVTYEDTAVGVVNLYSTKAKADAYNAKQVNSIDSVSVKYTARDTLRQRQYSNAFNNFPAVEVLEVKVGAQVMLIKNLDNKLVNGTVGVIVGFTKAKDMGNGVITEQLPIVKFELLSGNVFTMPVKRQVWTQLSAAGDEVASRSQIPLILAWAVTIHKSQGQTIERLKVDLTDVFESGQVYTALSRAVGPSTLEVCGFNANKVKVDDKALQYYVDNDLI